MSDTLVLRSQIRQYVILGVEHIGTDSIVYHAEDMQLSREVWLCEFFSNTMAERRLEDDGQSTVYASSTRNKEFTAGKTEFQNIYKNLKMLNHFSILTVYQVFESSGTSYAAIQYHRKATTFHKLSKIERVYSEQQIIKFALSLVSAFVLLGQYQLKMSLLNLDILLIDTMTGEPIAAYIEFIPLDDQGIQKSIYELGIVLRGIMDSENTQGDEHCIYSEKLCKLVDRMISDEPLKHFKTFQELQNLLQSYQPSRPSYEPIVHEKKSSIFSLFARLTSIIFIVIFAYYILTQQERIDNNEVNWFDISRIRLVAYFGNAEAQNTLGQLYEKGNVVDLDIAEALHWYKKAAEQGNVNAQISLGYMYQNGIGETNHEEAFKIFLKLATNGNLYAQKTLGHMYMIGQGTQRDYNQSIIWFTKAEERGDGYSCGAIGWMYYHGNGVAKDEVAALDWFKKGISRNDAFSKKEFEILKQKKENNSVKVSPKNKKEEQYWLGYQYEKGINVDKNHKKAIEHYLVAAELGNAKAQFRLAQLYERSEELTRNYWNYKSAIRWYKKASEHGDALAYYRVSKLYRSGHGVSKDKRLALQWCKKAAERGLGVACEIMGACYEFGWGTHIDYKQASYWYKQAIQSGYKNADESLNSLNKKIRVENQKLINTNIKKKAQLKKEQKSLRTKNFNTFSIDARKCFACHGKYFQRHALGKSAIVSNMTHYQIETALKGYKAGTYGGAMKAIMKGQVARYSDATLEDFSKTIGR